ncbi:MAG: hypothetical protein JWR14_7290, partial [Caballeronia sp.]|nr:hypothetical protein [Caballeronia sp.]
ERMLDSLPPDTHYLRRMIKSRLHFLDNCLVLPARHPALRSRRALLF